MSQAATIKGGEYVDHEMTGTEGNGFPKLTFDNGTKPETLADFLTEIEKTILKFVKLEKDELAMLLALWIIQSYLIKTFAFCGFLSLQSAGPQCGKSRLLEVLGCFTDEPTPLRTTPSPAVLYRGKCQTIFLDEVDSLRNADREKYGEVMSLLCVAFKRGGIVERCNKTSLKVERFEAYRAFAFAGLNSLSDSLNDRCFPIRMKRTAKKMPRLNLAKLEDETVSVRERIRKWWEQNSVKVKEIYSKLPDETEILKGKNDRLQDIAEPLLVLASIADAESKLKNQPITEKFKKAIGLICGRRENSSVEDGLEALIEIIEYK